MEFENELLDDYNSLHKNIEFAYDSQFKETQIAITEHASIESQQ